MKSCELASLIDTVFIEQLVSKSQINERLFDFELQGRDIKWNIRLQFYSTFPFSLPLVKVQNEECIGKIPHVNKNGVVCVEEGDSLLIDYHSPKELVETFLFQTLKTLERSTLRVFKNELFDELEGFIHGVDRVNSFFRAGTHAEELVLRLASQKNPLAPYSVNPIVLAKSLADVPKGFSNTDILNNYQLINIVHIPLDAPVVPSISVDDACRFICEFKKNISKDNLNKLIALLSNENKKQRRYFVVLSMPRSSGDRSEFLVQFMSKQPLLHPVLEDSLDWKLNFFLLNRHNKEYLLERGGADLSLNSKSVAIVGCGSIGSEIAIHIAKSGVGEIRLIDDDWLDADNIYRHSLGGRFLNFSPSERDKKVRKLSKVKALESDIKTNIPHIHIKAFNSSLTEQNFKGILEGVDIVIVAIGNPSVSLLLNRTLKEHQFNNAVFCWNEPDGFGGHTVALSLNDVCLECVLYRDSHNTQAINLVEFGQKISRNLTGCAGVFTPFSHLDSTKTASLAAEQAIRYLSTGVMNSTVVSWKGADNGRLQTTDRYKAMGLMEELVLSKNNGCKCCNDSE